MLNDAREYAQQGRPNVSPLHLTDVCSLVVTHT